MFCWDSAGFFRDSYHGFTMPWRNSMTVFSSGAGTGQVWFVVLSYKFLVLGVERFMNG